MMKIYIASKTKYAPRWRELRQRLLGKAEITSTWIDSCCYGTDEEMPRWERGILATRCVNDIRRSDALILYCEPGDKLCGALIEAGVALGLRKHVVCVGMCDRISAVFSEHHWWRNADSMDSALLYLYCALSQEPSQKSDATG